MTSEVNRQLAPYPHALADLVRQVSTPGRNWRFWLADEIRDPAEYGRGEASGLTLTIMITSPDARHPDRTVRVRFLFPVPPATYDMRSWRRWLFERCRDVDLHELCEAFTIGESTPYAPSHGPGNDPYLVREVGTAADADWRYNEPRPAVETGTGRQVRYVPTSLDLPSSRDPDG